MSNYKKIIKNLNCVSRVLNIMQEVINETDIILFNIQNSDIASVKDIRSLRNKITSLLNENKRIIVFMDEIDGIFKNRTELDCLSEPYSIINEALQMINNFNYKDVVFLGCTNYFEKIDAALTREGRFTKYEFNLPDTEERLSIVVGLFDKEKKIFESYFDKEIENQAPNKVTAFAAKFANQLGVLEQTKKEAIDMCASWITLFTVNQTQAYIVDITKTYINYMKELSGKKDINEVTEIFFEKIYAEELKNKHNIEVTELMHLINKIKNSNNNNPKTIFTYVIQESNEEDKKFLNIKSKKDFQLIGKKYKIDTNITQLKEKHPNKNNMDFVQIVYESICAKK